VQEIDIQAVKAVLSESNWRYFEDMVRALNRYSVIASSELNRRIKDNKYLSSDVKNYECERRFFENLNKKCLVGQQLLKVLVVKAEKQEQVNLEISELRKLVDDICYDNLYLEHMKDSGEPPETVFNWNHVSGQLNVLGL